MLISITIPCYNEQEVLEIFYYKISGITKKLYNYDFEFIFVDDGSNDRTLDTIKKFNLNDKRVKYISFSRNFGKEAAIYAGLSMSKGELIAVMDADLQDPPELLDKMISIIMDEGYDSVATRRVSRVGEPIIRSFFARSFYKIINRMSNTDIVDGARDYRIMNRKMVNSILSMKEYHRFSKGIFGWVGFKTKWIDYENVERIAGKTKWSFWNLYNYAIEGIVAFTTVPLKFSSFFGFLVSIAAFTYMIYIIIRTMVKGIDVPGYSSIIVLLLFIGGVQLISIGILGEYISKTYMEVKNRPRFIVKDTNFDEEGDKI